MSLVRSLMQGYPCMTVAAWDLCTIGLSPSSWHFLSQETLILVESIRKILDALFAVSIFQASSVNELPKQLWITTLHVEQIAGCENVYC